MLQHAKHLPRGPVPRIHPQHSAIDRRRVVPVSGQRVRVGKRESSLDGSWKMLDAESEQPDRFTGPAKGEMIVSLAPQENLDDDGRMVPGTGNGGLSGIDQPKPVTADRLEIEAALAPIEGQSAADLHDAGNDLALECVVAEVAASLPGQLDGVGSGTGRRSSSGSGTGAAIRASSSFRTRTRWSETGTTSPRSVSLRTTTTSFDPGSTCTECP